FDDPCGAALYAIWSEITGGGRWNRKERSGADGESLRLGKGKFGQREIVELEVAEPGSRPTDRIRICDHRWDDVKDLLDAVDLEGNQDSTDAVLGPVAVLIQVRCVVIPVLESKPRLGGAVSRVVAVTRAAGCRRILFLVGHARRRALSARFLGRVGMLFLGSLRVVILD